MSADILGRLDALAALGPDSIHYREFIRVRDCVTTLEAKVAELESKHDPNCNLFDLSPTLGPSEKPCNCWVKRIAELEAKVSELEKESEQSTSRFWFMATALWGDRDLEIIHDNDGETTSLEWDNYDGKGEHRIIIGNGNKGVIEAIDRALADALREEGK